MHATSLNNETNYKIVECQNPFCNICTRTAVDGGTPPSPLTERIAVYTCSNPSCSLCDGDYSLLLDIVNPTQAPTEDCFLQQYTTRSPRNAISEVQPTTARMGNKRRLSGHYGNSAKRRHSTSSKLCSDEVDSVDESQLMSLALELELDKIQWLPELADIIT